MKITNKTINYNVPDIDALVAISNPSENDVCVVTDENRGGTFIYRSAEVDTNNGGTIFNGWCRQYDGAVNVKWFQNDDGTPVKGDGINDDTTGIQKAIDFAEANAVPQVFGDNASYAVSTSIIIRPYIKLTNISISPLDGFIAGVIPNSSPESTASAIIMFSGDGGSIEDFSINASGKGYGIYVDNYGSSNGYKRIKIHKGTVYNATVANIFTKETWFTSFFQVYSHSCVTGYGFHLTEFGSPTHIDNCYVVKCDVGYRFEDNFNTVVNASGADQCNRTLEIDGGNYVFNGFNNEGNTEIASLSSCFVTFNSMRITGVGTNSYPLQSTPPASSTGISLFRVNNSRIKLNATMLPTVSLSNIEYFFDVSNSTSETIIESIGSQLSIFGYFVNNLQSYNNITDHDAANTIRLYNSTDIGISQYSGAKAFDTSMVAYTDVYPSLFDVVSSNTRIKVKVPGYYNIRLKGYAYNVPSGEAITVGFYRETTPTGYLSDQKVYRNNHTATTEVLIDEDYIVYLGANTEVRVNIVDTSASSNCHIKGGLSNEFSMTKISG